MSINDSSYYVHLSQKDLYWVCYLDNKRYSVTFNHEDPDEIVPYEWPHAIKREILRLKSCLSSFYKINKGKTGEHLSADSRFHMEVTHPISKAIDILTTVIISLNDTHKWTFDQIADWLETLDDQPKFSLRKSEEQKKESIRSTARVDEMC